MISQARVAAAADALMKAWFPSKYDDPSWMSTDDAIQWREIALMDAETVLESCDCCSHE